MSNYSSDESLPYNTQQQWLPIERAIQEVVTFEKRFGQKHFLLACHAALPFALTPELLNLIRINFVNDGDLFWIAEADFLLSSLCRQVNDNIFQVEPRVREVLLFELEERFQRTRLIELSHFLLAYLDEEPRWKERADIPHTQRWIALAYTHPERVVKEMKNLLEEAKQGNISKIQSQLQITTVLELVKEPLEEAALESLDELKLESQNLVHILTEKKEKIHILQEKAIKTASQFTTLKIPEEEKKNIPSTTKALKGKFNKPENLLLRARLYLEEGNTQNALQVLHEFASPDEQQQREIRYLTGWANVQLKHWEEAITSLAPILAKAEEELKNEQAELTDREQLAYYLLQLGVAAINLEHYQDAILHLNLCLKVLHDRHLQLPKVRIQAHYSLATAYMMRGLYPMAIQRYQEAAHLCESYNRQDELPNVYYGLAEAYRHAKDLVSAHEYAQKALDIYRGRNDREMECRIQNILGVICHLLGHNQDAAKYYNESTLLANLVNKPLIAMLNVAALAELYIEENDLIAARRHSDMAREYATRLERPVLLDAPYHISGKVAYAEAKKVEGARREELLKEAVNWYEKAISYMKQTQPDADMAEVYSDYAYALENLGRHKEAIALWRSGYQSLRDGYNKF